MGTSRTQTWQQKRTAGVVVSVLCFVLLGGMALYLRSSAVEQLAEYERLDRGARRVPGVISGWYRSGSRTTTYVLKFRFQADGKPCDGASPVTAQDYYSIHDGSPAIVLYLPSNPQNCRLINSIGPQRATSKLRSANLLLVMAFALPALMWLSLMRQLRRRG